MLLIHTKFTHTLIGMGLNNVTPRVKINLKFWDNIWREKSDMPTQTNATKDVVEQKIKIKEGEWELVPTEGTGLVNKWTNGKKSVIFIYGKKIITSNYIGEEPNDRYSVLIFEQDIEISLGGGPWERISFPTGPPSRFLPKTPTVTAPIPTGIPVAIPVGIPTRKMKVIPGKPKKQQTRTNDIREHKVCIKDGCTIIADVSDNHSAKFIYGRTQSGKTEETVQSITQRMEVDKCTGIYFCRAYTQEQSEQAENIRERIQEYTDLDVNVVLVKKAADYKNITNSMKNEDSSTLYVVMSNEASLSKIFESMTDGDVVRFAVALDEADMYVEEKSSSSISKKLKTIMSAAICKYFISATLLDVSNMLEETDIVEAIPSKFAFKNEVVGDDRVYHSLHQCVRYDIDIPKKNTEGGLECAMKCVGQALKDKLYVEYNNRGLPYLICQFHTEQVKPNEEIAKAMSASKVEGVDIAGITFDAKGATVYENGEVSKKFSRLNESIQYLKDKNTPVIHMMAGALCNRAFRVTSVDYEVYIGLGIYGYNNGQEASTAVQKLGRMCGLTPKRLMCVQRVFCDQKVFYKAVDCINITTSFVQTAIDNPDEKFADMKEMVVISERKSRKKLSVNGIESIFKVDKKIESVHGKLMEENEEEDADLSSIEMLKRMIFNHDIGTWRNHSTWYNLTGACGYKDKSNHHKAITQTLVNQGFVEKRKIGTLYEFRMKK